MAPTLTDHFSLPTPKKQTLQTRKTPRSEHSNKYPEWYSPDTGIYGSLHSSRDLPSDPFLDVVSFIFSFQHNGHSAFIDSSSGHSISYRELFPMVKSVASGLHKLGISQGDVVLLLIPNSIFYPVLVLGVMYLGAVVTTMFPQSSSSEIKKRISDCNVRLALAIPQKFGDFEAVGIRAIAVPENVNLGLMKLKPKGFSSFFELISGRFDLDKRPVIKQQDTAAILYSSGTTGVSKGVMLSHRNFISMVEHFVRFEASQYEYLTTENVYLAVIPMFHIYGLSLFVMGLLSLGSSVVVMSKFDIKEVVKAIDRFKVTHFPVVPPILTALAKTAEKVGVHRFQSLKQVSCGAASLIKKTRDDFLQALPHVDFIQGYGMTESTAVGTRGFNTKKAQKYSSVGLLAPNMEAKVVDWVSGSFMPPGKTGELLLRGPGLMKGYLNNPEATMSTIDEEEWLHTGDIVYFDQEGYLYVVDRLKEVIKYKGFQIAPSDLEAVVITHPEVVDVAVTAAIDEECGEIPVAFVVKKPGSKLSQKDVIDFVAQQVAPYKKVREVVFTEAIPKSAAGKVLRRVLKNHLSSKL